MAGGTNWIGGGGGGAETEAAANGVGGGGSGAGLSRLSGGGGGGGGGGARGDSMGSMRLRLNSRSMLETAGLDSLVKNNKDYDNNNNTDNDNFYENYLNNSIHNNMTVLIKYN